MEETLEKLVDDCLQKWSENDTLDERLVYFNDNFEVWLNQIPVERRPVVLTLIKNLEYYSHKTTNKWLLELHKQLIGQANISDDNTIFAFIKSKYGKTNSSNDYWTEYKFINKVNKNICIENLDLLDDEDWSFIENVVFIDDFSGSGKSFIDELKKRPDRYKTKNIYFITINVMCQAIKNIGEYGQEVGINVIVLSAFQREKAFERNLFDDDEEAKNNFLEMSEELGIPKYERLGYKETQRHI